MDETPRQIIDSVMKPKIGFDKVVTPEHEVVKPTFSQTLEAVVRNNDFVNIAGVVGKAFEGNPYADATEDFDIYDEKHYSGIPIEYWPQVAKAVGTQSEREVQVVRSNIEQEMNDASILAESGWTGGALSLISGTISPTSLFTVATAAKYASFGKSFLSGIKQTLPVAIASSVVSSTAESMNKETFGSHEWAKQVALDSLVGTGIGSLIGAKRIFDAKGIQKVKGALNAQFDGVDIQIKVGPKGEFQGYKATDLAKEAFTENLEVPHGSVGAMRAKEVNELLDNGIAGVGENWFFKKAFGASPIVKGLTSNFATVRKLTNKMWRHNLVTNEIARGNIPAGHTAHDIHMDWMGLSTSAQMEMRNAWTKYVGIDKGVFDGTQAWHAARKKGLLLEDDFKKEVAVATRNGHKHEIPEVQAISQHIYEKLYKPAYDDLVKLGLLDPNTDVATAISYLNKQYDKPAILANPEGFVEMVINHFNKSNQIIDTHMAPLSTVRGRIKTAREDLKLLNAKKTDVNANVYNEQTKSLKESIQANIKEAKKIKADLQKQIDEGAIPLKVLNGRPEFTPEERTTLELISKPFMDAEKELKAAKTSKNKERIQKAKEAFKKEREIIEYMHHQRKIDKKIVSVSKSGKVRFRTEQDKPWFRSKTKVDRMAVGAREIMETILEENQEQMASKMFAAVSRGGTPSPLKKRTLLIDDNDAQDFLVNDMSVLMDGYANQIGKHIGLEEMYRNYGATRKEGQKAIVEDLQREYRKSFDTLMQGPKSVAREKEIVNLKKDYENNLKFINDMNKVFMGDYVDLNSVEKRTTTALRNYNVSTQMGGLLVTSLTDLMLPVMKFGFTDYIADGVVPVLKNFKKLMIDKKLSRGDFADAAVACETYCSNMMAESWGAGFQYQPKTLWERIPKNLASMMGNLSMANQFSDIMQVMTATVSQSKTLRDLEKYIATGNISKKSFERFGRLGLDPHTWGERIVDQIKRFGDPQEGGAWVANVSKWTDLDAAQTFRIALNRDVKGTLSIQGPMDAPMWFRKPIIDCITQYMSWGFGATNNLVIPMLQRADAEKLTGMFALMSLGAFIGPLRQFASGREVEVDPKNLIVNAIFDSGILGWHGAEINKWNSALRIPFLENLKHSKYRNKTPMQLLGGPLGGTLESMQKMANMVLTGEWNQNDLKRAVGTVSYTGLLYLRRPVDAMIKGTGLPETAAEAREMSGD